MAHKITGNIQRLSFPCSLKAAVSDCIKTQNDKVLDLEVSSPKKPAQHLETISFVVRHQKSYTFHTFPSRLQIFPPTGSPDRQAFFMSGKASHRFFLQSHTDHRKRPRLLATNHKITVDFLGNRTNYLVDREDGGVLFIRGYW